MIEIKNLRKTYGKKVALKSFSYTFEDGIYGMLGANGAGKSTLMNLLTDNVKRDSGEILYDGKEILKMGGSYLEKVGYMPQQQGFYENFSARMFLVYMAELKGLRKKEAKKQIENLLEIVHLSHVADKKIGGFSLWRENMPKSCRNEKNSLPQKFIMRTSGRQGFFPPRQYLSEAGILKIFQDGRPFFL